MWSRTMKLSNDDTVTVLLCIIILICTLHCTPCKCHLERVRDISPPWRLGKQSYQHLLDVILLEDGCWHGQENGILLVGAQIIQYPHQHRAAYNIDLGHFFCRNPSISTNRIHFGCTAHQVAASSPTTPPVWWAPTCPILDPDLHPKKNEKVQNAAKVTNGFGMRKPASAKSAPEPPMGMMIDNGCAVVSVLLACPRRGHGRSSFQ